MNTDDAKAVLIEKALQAKEKRNKRRRDARRETQRKAPGGVQPVRRVYHDQDLLRIAYMAGEGRSAGEIVSALGGTTRWRVYALVRKLGINLAAKSPRSCVLRLLCRSSSFDTIARVALAHDLDPVFTAGRLLDELAAEPVLLENLVDGLVDEP